MKHTKGTTEKVAHTPGPWTAEPINMDYSTGYESPSPKDNSFLIASEDGFYLATIISDCIAEHEANARLIAAAPDLLAALERMVSQCGRHLDERPVSESDMLNPDYVSPMEQSLTAIARATTPNP